MQRIYFDNAATTAIDPEVVKVMTDAMLKISGNPASTHQSGRKARVLLETSRKEIASLLNCSSGEIIFTSGGSEADNLILYNAVSNLGVERIISSGIEHPAVLNTIKKLTDQHKVKVEYVNLEPDGSIDYDHLEELLKSSGKKTMISLMLVNNETGNILDAAKVSGLCKEHSALFHSDTVQYVAHLPVDLQKIPIDFLVASAHKFHGPKGVGFAYFKKGFGIKPMITGGDQEKGARAGTENIHSIAGMAKALRIAFDRMEKDQKHLKMLKEYFVSELKTKVPDIKFNGASADNEKSVHHILNVRFPKEIPMMLFNLDLKGIEASGGSACQSGSNKGSHVLNRILDSDESKKTSVRFSFSKYNTKEEIDKVIEVLTEILNR
ncbi:MAG: cysteine desulfurase [Flavobacteriia bacterium]|nr:MAG: cysteine desulfurase [Flavobacteriia bacterium]